MNTPEDSLQQLDRTYVRWRGGRFSFFGGCDYFRLASHPAVLAAVREGLEKFGLNVAASRRTTGNHWLYNKLEQILAGYFATACATFVSNGYLTNLVAAQALAGRATHILIDERAHASLVDAAAMSGLPTRTFRHRDVAAAGRAAKWAGRHAKLLLFTDGLFSHSGQVAPLGDYLSAIPNLQWMLVDDAHGAGILGRYGRGTTEFLGLSTRRVVQTITLSKALGVYGGAVLGPRWLGKKIVDHSRIFTGNTPLPLPLVCAAMKALELAGARCKLRRQLAFNAGYVKAALKEAGWKLPDGPGPIVPIIPDSRSAENALRRRLISKRILPPFIQYPGGPKHGYFRFVISSEHSAEQLDALVSALR